PSDLRGAERAGDGLDDALPNLIGLVLDPARLRKVLRELAGGATEGTSLHIHDERGASGRPLVDGKKLACHGRPSMPFSGAFPGQLWSAGRRANMPYSEWRVST